MRHMISEQPPIMKTEGAYEIFLELVLSLK